MAKETTENQNVKSKRDAFRERFSKRYPNINMDDEDAVYGQFSTDYDQFDQNNQRMDVIQRYPLPKASTYLLKYRIPACDSAL